MNGSMDDLVLNVTLPFPITLYNTTSYHAQVTTNGVRIRTFIHVNTKNLTLLFDRFFV